MTSKDIISRPIRIGLRITGIWPWPYENVFRLAWCAVMCPVQVFQYSYIKNHFDSNSFVELVECVSTTLPYSLLCFKLFTFWTKRGIFNDALASIAADWTNASLTKDNIKTMKEKVHMSNRCSQLILAIYVIAVLLYSGVYVNVFFNIGGGDSDIDLTDLVMKMKLPFTYNEAAYRYVMIGQAIQLMSVACAIGTIDCLMIAMILHVGGQVEVIHQTLAEISPDNKEHSLSNSTVKYLVTRHQKIINFTTYIDSLFSYVALMQILCNTFSICGVGFLVVVSFESDQKIKIMIKILFFYICIASEAFVFCVAGEYLSTKSTSIYKATYNSIWYLLKPANSRLMLLFMVRAQRPSTITAGKIMDLSLQRFANIMKTSASYISILYAMRDMGSPSTVSKSVRCGLHFVGIWPGTPLPGLHKLLWVVFMGVFQTYQYTYIVKRLGTDSLVDLIDSLSVVLPDTLVAIKLTVAWINHGVLRDILSTMQEDYKKYAVIDTNNLIPKAANLSFRLTTAIAMLYPTATVFYTIGTLGFQQTNDSTTRRLLLNMDLPFDTSESPIHELVITSQFLYILTSSFTFGIFSALFLMLTLHVGCNIDILCNTLQDPFLLDNEQIRFFISRQEEIVVFVNKIESLFTYIALCQLLSNTLITCCLGYLIIITISTEDSISMLIKSVLFYYVICLEAFIYCFVGEYLDIKSKMIANAAYESLWYNLKPINSRQLVLLIMKAQKGLPLTFGKFSNLNLESFTSIMKASASYMSVLLAMS
ncbi:uncharacterized protein LOC116430397 [Nomia melanderi]|uniref:uncharacterized protein LOC116430397 n=1 Tax=Nomia melanderi TaxID=2448451 RepID=UPI003FCE5FCA